MRMIKVLLALCFLSVTSAVLAMPDQAAVASHKECACSAKCGSHCGCCGTPANPNPCGCGNVRIQGLTSAAVLPRGPDSVFSLLPGNEPVYCCMWQEDLFHPPRASA